MCAHTHACVYVCVARVRMHVVVHAFTGVFDCTCICVCRIGEGGTVCIIFKQLLFQLSDFG